MSTFITPPFTTLSLISLRIVATVFQHLLSQSFFSGGIGMLYAILYTNFDGLMARFHTSKVFPASSRQTGGLVSRNVLRTSQKRIQESRARQARA
jgi:hypothetical protein